MKYIFYIITIISFLSCKDGDQKEGGSLIKIKEYLFNYTTSHDTKYLEKSYNELSKNNDFQKKGLTLENKETVISLLMYMKKYDELKVLLEKTTTIDPFKKRVTLNLIKYLMNKKDEKLSKKYIHENISLIQKKIDSDPGDSLIYIDYFIMKLYLKGREKTLKEVDSMQKYNKKQSDVFYDYILKDLIEEYPEQYM